jgi:putative effector of murein hydrolase LrgA (UPF0299 family)
MRSIWKTASVWGLVGVGIPLLFMLGSSLLGRLLPSPLLTTLDGLRQDIELFVWPSSFWLMATEGAGRASTIEIVVMAILANFVIYFLVGLLLTAAWRALRVGAHAKDRPSHGPL